MKQCRQIRALISFVIYTTSLLGILRLIELHGRPQSRAVEQKRATCIYRLCCCYIHESWSLTLREERRLRVFENGVLRRIFGPKRDEVTGGWRKLHNEELKGLYSSPNKRPLGRPRRRWEDNIRMDLQEVGLGYEDWIGLAQDRDKWRALVSAVRNLRVP